MNKEVQQLINAVSDERRALYDKLHELIMSMYPDAEVAIYYGIPTYKVKGGRVGLGYWKGGVSFFPYGGGYLDEFRARYPAIKSSKGTINFKLSDKIPVAALKKVIKTAIEHPTRRWG